MLGALILLPFFPKGDSPWIPREKGLITAYFELPPGLSGARRGEITASLEKSLKGGHPEIKRVMTREEGGRVEISLYCDKNGHDLDRFAEALTGKYQAFCGGFLHLAGGGEGEAGGGVSTFDVTGDDRGALRALASETAKSLSARPWCHEVLLHFREGRETLTLIPRAGELRRAGLTVAEGGEWLRGRLFGPVAGKFLGEGGEEDDIRLRLTGYTLEGEGDLSAVALRGTNGGGLGLGSAFDFEKSLEQSRRHRLGRKPVERFSVRAKAGSGAWQGDRDLVLATVERPPGVRLEVGGDERKVGQKQGEVARAALAAVLLVYMLLACLHQSFSRPLAVMALLLPAGAGALWGLFLTGRPLDSGALMGLCMLAGLSVNAGILMEDALAGARTEEAVGRACRMRLPTALLTGVTFLVGLSPLLIMGEGPVAAMAVVLFFGTLAALVASLILLPLARMPGVVLPLPANWEQRSALDRFWWKIQSLPKGISISSKGGPP